MSLALIVAFVALMIAVVPVAHALLLAVSYVPALTIRF